MISQILFYAMMALLAGVFGFTFSGNVSKKRPVIGRAISLVFYALALACIAGIAITLLGAAR
ncbi:hypothetical protein HME9302_00158 [Alteripontixanthobacter maritimus]|uniref:Uncharacterized protein n=1 Tax=Alteripontixanthobacter maritimus TaxID=2161824 RepID=A0A369Q246_9SPHN|nr:hypothetical protein [Alteripontixanthobacter maritimus]RDC58981.1 hypothetical protein HME9302_00158 [Alteripontixanthobacter maritimus]